MSKPIRPCYWMRGALTRIAEGRPLGIFAWYVRKHLSGCKQCTKTLEALLFMKDHLMSGRTTEMLLPEEKWAEIEKLCRPEKPEEPYEP